MDDNDDGARVGLWVTLAVVTLLLFGLLGGLAIRQVHKAAPASAAAASTAEALIEGPLTGDLLGQVYFETAVATLPADAAAAIGSIQAALTQAGGSGKLVLSGFHDASGDPAKNAELAKQRAKAVRAALQAAGVDPARMALRKPESTTGEGKPEAARRVEVRLLP